MSISREPSPASRRVWTAGAVFCGVYAKAGQPAVVGICCRSMLSLMAKGTPYRGVRPSGAVSTRLQVDAPILDQAW